LTPHITPSLSLPRLPRKKKKKKKKNVERIGWSDRDGGEEGLRGDF
jgi:hypothetical protein